MADWILVGDDLAFLTDCIVQFVAYGIGLGAVLWLVGWCVYWLQLFVRY